MAKRRCTDSEADAVLPMGEKLSTKNEDVQKTDGGQNVLDETPRATIEDLPNEILEMILSNVRRKDQNACRLVNWRLHKISNCLLATTPCDKPKNCYYSKKRNLLFIGELESENEVAALRKKIKSLTTLNRVVISWEELWGQSDFNNSFLFGNPEGDGLLQRGAKFLTLQANKIGKVKPENDVRILKAEELRVDIKIGLDATTIEEILSQFCYDYGIVHIAERQPLNSFLEAVRKIYSKYRSRRGLSLLNHELMPPLGPLRLGVVLKSSDDFSQIGALTDKQHVKLTHLEVYIKKRKHIPDFLKILVKHANFLKSLKIKMSTLSKIKNKWTSIIWPTMNSLEKLEVTVVGPGEDAEGNILPPLLKFGYNGYWYQPGGCVKRTFPSLKRLCIRPPMTTDDEKWDAIYKAYYDNFLCVRRPDNDAPLVKWNPGLRNLKLGFPPKRNESKFGGDKYQRFCLELAKISNVDKAFDNNNKVEVQLSRFK